MRRLKLPAIVRSSAIFKSVCDLTEREKQHLIREMGLARGLMPLLMKPRNKQRWTSEDKVALAVQLRRLSSISPYLVVMVMPGGMLMLPALAWWLDRRRNRRMSEPAVQG